jgi:hypothetical protein
MLTHKHGRSVDNKSTPVVTVYQQYLLKRFKEAIVCDNEQS